MKLKLILITIAAGIASSQAFASEPDNYANNRYPLMRKPYVELPLGSIKAQGWLHEMLLTQKNGSTGRLDELYPLVMGPRNGWLGGDGDQWERGPYWIDGLLPLAYILDDAELKAKAQVWVEWTLASQNEEGNFGPSRNYEPEPGLQRNNCLDWWPRMVVLKILQQYYSATGDRRVISFMTNYFRYQLQTLPEKPLDHWTYWGRYRACDNLQAVYWLYNITGDKFLLELAEIVHSQSHDYTGMFLNSDDLSRPGTIHCVNLAQGIKEPAIYYQQSGKQMHLDAVKQGFNSIRRFDELAHGLYGGDETLHGNVPTQGSELCSAVEMMYSLEHILSISGDLAYADKLEKIAFNALPTQISDDFMTRQYFQQANQVQITREKRNFDTDHGQTDLTFGLMTGYQCCTANMHQGWPKFTQNLWYATPDNGLAAIIYSPSEVTAKVADGCLVSINEETYYPMGETISFKVKIMDKKRKEVTFPLHLRIPSWCNGAVITINGQSTQPAEGGKVVILDRSWKSSDVVELSLPMHVKTETWVENSISLERGPLVYALKMSENWKEKEFADREKIKYGDTYWEVTSPDKWNYGIIRFKATDIDKAVKVIIDKEKLKSPYPWNLENAPIELQVKARTLDHWKLYNGMAGPLPYSAGNANTSEEAETITLIPYGCTTLRISQFPLVRK